MIKTVGCSIVSSDSGNDSLRTEARKRDCQKASRMYPALGTCSQLFSQLLFLPSCGIVPVGPLGLLVAGWLFSVMETWGGGMDVSPQMEQSLEKPAQVFRRKLTHALIGGRTDRANVPWGSLGMEAIRSSCRITQDSQGSCAGGC